MNDRVTKEELIAHYRDTAIANLQTVDESSDGRDISDALAAISQLIPLVLSESKTPPYTLEASAMNHNEQRIREYRNAAIAALQKLEKEGDTEHFEDACIALQRIQPYIDMLASDYPINKYPF